MTPDDFRTALDALGFTQRGFATYTGSNERTVRRWALGEQDIPSWVPVLLKVTHSQRRGIADKSKGYASYDPKADAIGIYFAPEGAEYWDSEEIAPGVTLDYDKQGQVIGVELLYVRDLLAGGPLTASASNSSATALGPRSARAAVAKP